VMRASDPLVGAGRAASLCPARRTPVSTLMIVQFKPSAFRQTRWYEYLVRFALGGTMTVVAGLIAARFGPVIAACFSPFPRARH
jgi:hypothetical protein